MVKRVKENHEVSVDWLSASRIQMSDTKSTMDAISIHPLMIVSTT